MKLETAITTHTLLSLHPSSKWSIAGSQVTAGSLCAQDLTPGQGPDPQEFTSKSTTSNKVPECLSPIMTNKATEVTQTSRMRPSISKTKTHYKQSASSKA